MLRKIYNLCKSVGPEDEDSEEKIIVYEQNDEVWVLYSLQEELPIKVKAEKKMTIRLTNLRDSSNLSGEYVELLKRHQMSTVYFTNAFDMVGCIKEYGYTDYTEFDKKKSVFFSPLVSIKKEIQWSRDYYSGKGRFGLTPSVKQYAGNMELSVEDAYVSNFCYNLFTILKFASSEVLTILPSCKEIEADIIEFGSYRTMGTKSYEPFDDVVDLVKKEIYQLKYNVLSSILEKVYLNFICEIMLYLISENVPRKIQNMRSLKRIKENMSSGSNCRSMFDKIVESQNVEDYKDIIDQFVNVYNQLVDDAWYQQLNNVIKQENILRKITEQNIHEFSHFFLDNHDNYEKGLYRMFRFTPIPMSSGEMALVNILACLYKVIEDNEVENNILLIIDEIDAFLHPRWQQDILTRLTKIIGSKDFKNRKVQIVFATHSPIILSDMTADRIVRLSKGTVVRKGEKTFGADMNRLYYDSFFMKEGSIGGIAREKIQEVLDDLQQDSSKSKGSLEQDYIIKNIGDSFLRGLLSRKKKKAGWGKNDKN